MLWTGLRGRFIIIAFVNEILVAGLGIFSAVALFALQQRSTAREQLRQHFADALADIYRWAELPYRVRRRNPAPEVRYEMAARISDLQEQLQHHSAWLRVENRDVHAAFIRLRDVVKEGTRADLQSAWKAAAIESDSDMSLGSTGSDWASEVAAYGDAVRRHLRWYVWAFWR